MRRCVVNKNFDDFKLFLAAWQVDGDDLSNAFVNE